MVACCEPEEPLEGSESVLFPSETLPAGTEQDVRGGEFWDDRTGKPLDSEKVRAARAEELRELDRRVWVGADVQECLNKKGRGPMAVRWVDVDKGFGVYRSRFVAKDFKPKNKVNDQEGLFAKDATSGTGQDGHVKGCAGKSRLKAGVAFFFCCGPHVCAFGGHHDGW